MRTPAYDLLCLGSGPAGENAAIHAAKAGFRTAIVDREAQVGGACLLSGTIPSKALREQALRYRRLQGRSSSLAVALAGDAPLAELLRGVERVIDAQAELLRVRMRHHGVDLIRGMGRILDPRRVEVMQLDGSRLVLGSERLLIATGSRPRHVAHIQVDHEHILDSDSILSLPYLPRSMIVLGSGVIACEYASIFAALGCEVTLVDKATEPLGFLDPVLRRGFLASFAADGGRYLVGGIERVAFDGVSQVVVHLQGGGVLQADIALAALGRIANLEGIGAEELGMTMSARGHVEVDARFATSVAGIHAAGDVIGPPSLACAAADQGRRAALAALGRSVPSGADLLPIGVYTIPEIACVGLTETEAASRRLEICVGVANFGDVVRAHIAGAPDGFLRLLCERGTRRVLGAQALGESSADLVHLAQAVISAGATVDYFVDHVFNFPTMTEAYRVAAFDCLRQMRVTGSESEYRRIHCI
jgi:NAD(P) transhydrogenase